MMLHNRPTDANDPEDAQKHKVCQNLMPDDHIHAAIIKFKLFTNHSDLSCEFFIVEGWMGNPCAFPPKNTK